MAYPPIIGFSGLVLVRLVSYCRTGNVSSRFCLSSWRGGGSLYPTMCWDGQEGDMLLPTGRLRQEGGLHRPKP